jgi:hypothetical protein
MKTNTLLAVIEFSRACELVPRFEAEASEMCDLAFQFNVIRRALHELAQRNCKNPENWGQQRERTPSC